MRVGIAGVEVEELAAQWLVWFFILSFSLWNSQALGVLNVPFHDGVALRMRKRDLISVAFNDGVWFRMKRWRKLISRLRVFEKDCVPRFKI